MLNFLFLW